MKAILALEDGMIFEGESFGAAGERVGEVVFNTSMTGYQEILTDPSYKGQMVTLTYPLIGNYGQNPEDIESASPKVEALIVREYSSFYSNYRAEGSLAHFLGKYDVIGIQGIDTRALTRHIRTQGAMNGVISTIDLDKERLVEKARWAESIIGRDLVKLVTCDKPYLFQPRSTSNDSFLNRSADIEQHSKHRRLKVVAFDYGIKLNILEELALRNCEIWVVPANTSKDDALAFKPDGILLSNGPGDPEGVMYAVEIVRDLIGQKPIFGICLGHQLLGLALGGKTYKLKFGHRGANHPVRQRETGKVEITSQNHGFCVDKDSIPDPDIILTHENLNDNTLEGMKHKKHPLFSVQYHPEASAGPHDSKYLFDEFIQLMLREE